LGWLGNVFSTFVLAAKRLWNNRWLMVAVMVGLVAAVGLVMSVPLYADAISHRLLQEELARGATVTRPPFTFRYQYIGAWYGAVDWQDCAALDTYLTTTSPSMLGLPQMRAVRHIKTDNYMVFPGSEQFYEDPSRSLTWAYLGYMTDLESHIWLIEGQYPRPSLNPNEPIEVLVSLDLADEVGFQVGERYVLFDSRMAKTSKRTPTQLPVVIAGIWGVVDETDPYWPIRPSSFDDVFLVPEQTFMQRLAPTLEQEVYGVMWHHVYDGTEVQVEDVDALLGRIVAVRSRVASLLSHADLYESPEDALREYRFSVYVLTILLYVFSIPVVGLVLYFTGLVSAMVVRRQRGEVAALRSRGASRFQVLGVYVLEGGLVAVAALVVGTPLAMALAGLMGKTRSFLVLVDEPSLLVRVGERSLRYGVLAVLLSVAANVIPAIGASGHTVVTYKQERARSLRKPLWQRFYLDFLLLVPPLYGYYMLKQRGTISILGQNLSVGNPYQNPLLFLVPTLFVFAVALICIRFLPAMMSALAWAGARLRGASHVLALRHLARSPGQYLGPLLLLVLTLSLAVFAASMARTLDRHLTDRVYYDVGADMNLVEVGDFPESASGLAFGGPAEGDEPEQEAEEQEEPRWRFLPVSDHLTVPGVRAAARVGDYRATARLGGRATDARFLGVDRVDFAQVAYFRPDFWGGSMGTLMNQLALDSRALLASWDFMAANGLHMGDRVLLSVRAGETKEMEFTITGGLDYFPTLYPEDGPFFVGNLAYVFDQLGAQYPYDVWLSVESDADGEAIVEGLTEVGFHIGSAKDSPRLIAEERGLPERRGIYGLLSVGFMAAAILTVVGFMLYAIISFRRRFIELGVLRAIGLSVTQLTGFLVGEQLALIAAGTGLGTALGVLTSNLFIPFLQVRAGEHPQTPPFVVQIAWQDVRLIYAIFGSMLLIAVLIMVVLLVRMRIFQAIKLGETA
jgi:putative ABC transport system permease protein